MTRPPFPLAHSFTTHVACTMHYVIIPCKPTTLQFVPVLFSFLCSQRSQRSVLHFKLTRLANGTYQFGNHNFPTVRQLQHHFENEQPSIGGDIGSVTPECKRMCVHLFVLLPLVFMYMRGEGGEGWRRQCVKGREQCRNMGMKQVSRFTVSCTSSSHIAPCKHSRDFSIGLVDLTCHNCIYHWNLCETAVPLPRSSHG